MMANFAQRISAEVKYVNLEKILLRRQFKLHFTSKLSVFQLQFLDLSKFEVPQNCEHFLGSSKINKRTGFNKRIFLGK